LCIVWIIEEEEEEKREHRVAPLNNRTTFMQVFAKNNFIKKNLVLTVNLLSFSFLE
jgi:hypothetical protein